MMKNQQTGHQPQFNTLIILYAKSVKLNKRTIEQVPERIREAVKAKLEVNTDGDNS